MKVFTYTIIQTTIIDGVDYTGEDYLSTITVPYTEEEYNYAKSIAYNGQITEPYEFTHLEN